ncbi:hypothetical protein [Fundidesulfovibrio putealis]|uniref:hypothetical protein n=1 Tax=Fundidesulfovibrio putealis TaxID=270496 RepID=UPI0004209E58|nr:hypothetical protein [Fundidesulfovibrio putealis]
MTRENLLVDPLLTIDTPDGGQRQVSLPGLFAAMERGEVFAFPKLRPHQDHPWHAFLCQLAALALRDSHLPQARPGHPETWLGQHDEEGWRVLLRTLTSDFRDDEPWRLVVEDPAKPAFMQPPVEGSALAKQKPEDFWATPDDMDVLETAKRHGIKNALIDPGSLEHWVYALVSVQTQAPFGGSGHQASSRQNGAYGARSGVGIRLSQRVDMCWARDTRILLDHPDHWAACGIDYDFRHGLALVWLVPWNGETSLAPTRLHPWYIEISRLTRLKRTPAGLLHATYITASSTRVEAKETHGNVGDPWVPILKETTPKSYNSVPRYHKVCEVLFDDEKYVPSLMQMPAKIDGTGPMTVCFRFLSRGQSKTEGYHERHVPFGHAQSRFLGARKNLALEMSRSMIELASRVEQALYLAALKRMQAGRPVPDAKQPETSRWANRIRRDMDDEVNEHFFPRLWDCLERHEDGATLVDSVRPWLDWLASCARTRFALAGQSLPSSCTLGMFAQAQAEILLERKLSGIFNPQPLRRNAHGK